MSARQHHPSMAPPSTAIPHARGSPRPGVVAIPVGEGGGSTGGAPASSMSSVAAPGSPDLARAELLAPVVRTKIEPPPLRSSTLSRGRLIEALANAIARRVTLVTAEAGYGKTTLLTDFSSRPIARCLWYKLDGVVVRVTKSCRLSPEVD